MTFVVCIVPVSPMRKEASHRSEMVSQLLFGETAEVMEEHKGFTRLRCLYDHYEGWCQSSQLTSVELSQINGDHILLSREWTTTIDFNGHHMQLPMGTPLTILTNGKAQLGKYAVAYHGKTWDPLTALFEQTVIQALAMQYLNTTYVWGGCSVFGIDCSGFVQQIFRFFHKKLPRDAYQQAAVGEVVGFLQEVQCGDLAFFDNDQGHITHVGLLFTPDTIIHSSGKVRIDKIDNMGIINSDTGERTHRLRLIKRYGEM